MDLNNKELPPEKFEFLSLEGACSAEVDILHNMLFKTENNSPIFNLKQNLHDPGTSSRKVGSNAVSHQNSNSDSNNSSRKVSLQSEQLVNNVGVNNIDNSIGFELPPNSHVPIMSSGEVRNDISSANNGMIMNHMRNYYSTPGTGPPQHMMANHVSMGYAMPPNMMYMSHIPPMHYGISQQNSYVQNNPRDAPPLSPESNHSQSSYNKSHHQPDGGHPTKPYRGKHPRNDRGRRNEDQQQQQMLNQYPQNYYNYGGMSYAAPAGYYNQVQAQNLTGTPIIMPPHPNGPPQIYPYHQPMYTQAHGNDIPQTMSHIPQAAPIIIDNKGRGLYINESYGDEKGSELNKENQSEDGSEPIEAHKTELTAQNPIENNTESSLIDANIGVPEADTITEPNESDEVPPKSKLIEDTVVNEVEKEIKAEIGGESSQINNEATPTPPPPSTSSQDGKEPPPPALVKPAPVNNNATSVRSWASIASSNTPNENGLNRSSTGSVTSSSSDAAKSPGSGQYFSAENTSTTNEECHNVPSPPSSTFPTTSTSGSKSEEACFSGLNDDTDEIALNLGQFLSEYKLNHNSAPLTPRGLSNQSNFCYINATLQALLSCPPFVNLFRSPMLKDILKKPSKTTPIIQAVFEFVNDFEPLNRSTANKRDRRNDSFFQGPNLDPSCIRKVLPRLDSATFKIEGKQEDAEEFLSLLLNGLHEEMIKVMKWWENKKERLANKGMLLDEAEEMNGEVENEDDDEWTVMGPKNKGATTRRIVVSKSPISEAFRGQMCTSINAKSIKSSNIAPFYTLQLDISSDKVKSVRDALEGIPVKEEVSSYRINGVEHEAWRQMTLDELPAILILHLKRFVYDKNTSKIQKLTKKLEFSVDLDIGKELLSVQTRGRVKFKNYKLFAVVHHDGEEAHKGHYVADCFHPSSGSLWGPWGWLRYDDTSVNVISEDKMVDPIPPRVPYLLYYRRTDTLVSHSGCGASVQSNNKKQL